MSGSCVLVRVAAALLIWLFGAGSIHAATFTVNSTADAIDANIGNGVCATSGAVCTLRAAVQEANALAGADTINLTAGTHSRPAGTGAAGEDLAATGDLDVRESLTINGANASTTIIDVNGRDRVFQVIGAANLTMSDLTIREGDVSGDGGGISSASGTVTLTDVAVRNNIANGKGGGIFNLSGTLALNRVTISANSASSDGGGIFTESSSVSLSLINVTVSGNSTNGSGGGIYQSSATTTLTNVTVASNTGNSNGRQIHRNAGTITLKNTIVSGASAPNCSGTITSAGNNLDSANTCGFIGPGDRINTNPLLVALANNGGQTQTHALPAGSPAIDAGTNTGAPLVDQRGVFRPQDGDGNASTITDIGAYEVGSVPTVSGTVFEDINYGGGAGRSLAASGGIGRLNARVELYDAGDVFITFTTTNAAGQYLFAGVAPGPHIVRVVNSSVTSSRSGAVAGLLPVQTFRTNGLSGTTGTPDTARVGGEAPELVDAGNGSLTLGALTTGTTTAQSIGSVTMTGLNLTGIDFGFNFDTVVSTRDAGQGSLRQFILNSNALGSEGSLAQAGSRLNGVSGASEALPSGKETGIFMIPDGAADPGLRAGLVNQLTGGVAVITPLSLLPAISSANTTIDGGTQSFNVGNTNSGTLGAGGTVGVDSLALSTIQRPEVQIQDGAASLAIGLDAQANNTTIRGISIFGFGNAVDTNNNHNIRVGGTFSAALIEQNVVGAPATSFNCPGAGALSGGGNIRSTGGDNGIIRNNLIGCAAGKGIGLNGTVTGWQIIANEIRGNAIGNSSLDGIDIESSSGTTLVEGNLIVNNQGVGVDSLNSAGSNTIRNNTITGNGIGAGAGGSETPGVRLYGAGNTVDRNVLTANYGAGVMVTSGSTGNTITRNSIFTNGTIGAPVSGQIGIDLQAATNNASTGTAPFVTLNDSGDGDAGGNALSNYPVIQAASITGGNLTLSGFARPGSVIEFFIAAADPSGFGEGQTYLVTLTEGSAQDTDATTGTYGPAAVNGLAQGTDTTNRFSFTIPVPGGVAVGTVLSATATLASNTSEFSGNVTVTLATPATVTGTVYLDVNASGARDGAEAGTGQTLFVKIAPRTGAVCNGPATAAAAVDVTTGAYSLAGVTAGDYCLIVDGNATLADITPTTPAGYLFIAPPTGTLQITFAATALVEQNFGLFNGSRLTGRVFSDTGAGGGVANNGIQDGAESGIASVALSARNASCAAGVCGTAVTSGAGDYVLFVPAAASGTVDIVEVNLSNFVSTGGQPGSTGGTYTRATDTTAFAFAAGQSYSSVNFADVPENVFTTDGAAAGLPGATVFYSHSFTAGSGGQVSFSRSTTASPAIGDWNPIVYRDVNCNAALDAAEGASPLSSPIAVIAGERVCIVIKEFIPANAPFNATDRITVSASFNYANANPVLAAAYNHTDITTVGVGLKLAKTVRNVTSGGAAITSNIASPGHTLEYVVTYSNPGSEVLSTIVIHDTTPAYTLFVSASCGAPLPPNISSCSVTTQPAAGTTGALTWTLTGTLASGASGTVICRVTVE